MKKLVRNFVDEAMATLAKPSQTSHGGDANSTQQYSTYGLPLPVSPYQGQYGQQSPYEQQKPPYGYSNQQPTPYNIPSSAQYFPPPPNAQAQVPLSYYSYQQPPTIPVQHAVYSPPPPQQQEPRPHEPQSQPVQPLVAPHTPYSYPTYPPQAETTQHPPVIAAPPTPHSQPQYGVPPTHQPNYNATPAPAQPTPPPQTQHQYQYEAQYAPPPTTPAPPQPDAMTVVHPVTPPELPVQTLATPVQHEPIVEIGTGTKQQGSIVEIGTNTQHVPIVEIGTSTVPTAPVEAPAYPHSPAELQNPTQALPQPQLLSSTPAQQHIVAQPPMGHAQEQHYFPSPPQLVVPSPQPTPQPQTPANYTQMFQPPAQPPTNIAQQPYFPPPQSQPSQPPPNAAQQPYFPPPPSQPSPNTAQQPYFPPPPSQPLSNTLAPQNYAHSVCNSPTPAFNNGNSQEAQGTSGLNQYQYAPPPLPQYDASQAPVGQVVPPPDGPAASLSSMMSKLNVQSGIHMPPLGFTPAVVDDSPREYPPIRVSGDPVEVLAECTGSRPRTNSLAWHRPVEQPDFLICTRCFADHIQSTPLAVRFERIQRPDGVESACTFWQPHVKDRLWPAAVQSGDISAICQYMARRLELPACAGRGPSPSGESKKGYGLAQRGVHDEFVICETCYEDYMGGSSFETRFSLRHSTSEKQVCGMGLQYLKDLAEQTTKTDNWDAFMAGVARRLRLPACQGKPIQNSAATWYVTRQKIKKMRICEACYLDYVAVSRFKSEFEQYVPPSGLKGLKEVVLQSTCLFARFAVPTAWGAAIYRRDFSVFRKAAETITPIVPCTADGIVGGNWWTLRGGCDGFSVCETCYAGIFQPMGSARFLEKTRREGGILCSFCPATALNIRIVLKFSDESEKGLFGPFEEYVRKWADVKPCPVNEGLEKAKWYGWPELLVCPECYHAVVADKPLADSMPCQRKFYENPNLCQMWSPRMRTMWLETCDAGPPGSPDSQAAVAKLTAFGAHRMSVYKQTVVQVEQLEVMRLSKIMLANAQMNAAVTQDAMASQGAVFGTSDPGAHIAAENAMQQSRITMNQANSPEHFHTVARLNAMWLTVE